MNYMVMLLCSLVSVGIIFQQGVPVNVEDGIIVHTYTKQMSNVHIIQKGDRFLMIDTGLPDDTTQLLKFLAEHSIDPLQIDYIILTHGHPDHAGNAAFFQQKYGIRIMAGAAEMEIIEKGGLDEHLCPRGLPGRIVSKTIASQRYVPFQPDILISGKTVLDTLGWKGSIEVFESHTAGSLVFFIDHIAFVGDLIKGKLWKRSKPSYHVFMCDRQANLTDLQSIAQRNKTTKWYLGHMGPLMAEDVITFIKKNSTKYE